MVRPPFPGAKGFPVLASLQQSAQRPRDMREACDKPAVEVHKAEENLDLLKILRGWLIRDGRDLLRVHPDAILAYEES